MRRIITRTGLLTKPFRRSKYGRSGDQLRTADKKQRNSIHRPETHREATELKIKWELRECENHRGISLLSALRIDFNKASLN